MFKLGVNRVSLNAYKNCNSDVLVFRREDNQRTWRKNRARANNKQSAGLDKKYM